MTEWKLKDGHTLKEYETMGKRIVVFPALAKYSGIILVLFWYNVGLKPKKYFISFASVS
ncbi:MAG: hypothetical protein Q8907_15765 [Bacteroidota bacterium]|nr:hypothetical protein [Bacteroidota bacterium]